MKRWIALATMILALASAAAAGDVATLVNLGFSPDSAYFMFGFYGIDAAAGKPYAEIFAVDTKRNEYVPGGSFRGLYAIDLQPGWNPSGAFYRLFADATPIARKLRIDHLQQGRLVYLLIDGAESPDAISFKDFDTGAQWDVALKETVEEKGGSVVSSFGVVVTVTTADGKKTTVKGGNPTFKRAGVSDYTIRQIFVAPDGKTVVMLIERLERSAAGATVRYMVETLKLP